MTLIYSSDNFIVESADKPHIDRNDGGHIRILPKERVPDRQHLTAKQSIELARLLSIVGQAMQIVMNKRGVDVGRINYQDMGNWTVFDTKGPYLHYHIYGRAKSAKYQKYGETVITPLREKNPKFYERFKPLNNQDVKEIKLEISGLLKDKKYSNKEWGL